MISQQEAGESGMTGGPEPAPGSQHVRNMVLHTCLGDAQLLRGLSTDLSGGIDMVRYKCP